MFQTFNSTIGDLILQIQNLFLVTKVCFDFLYLLVIVNDNRQWVSKIALYYLLNNSHITHCWLHFRWADLISWVLLCILLLISWFILCSSWRVKYVVIKANILGPKEVILDIFLFQENNIWAGYLKFVDHIHIHGLLLWLFVTCYIWH